MHLVTETAPGVAVVRELGSKYHLAHLLIGTIRLGVVPEFLEVAAQWMLLDYLVAILDDCSQVGILILGVPAVVQF